MTQTPDPTSTPPNFWTDEMESNFLASFIGERAVFRPVGPPKHFCMLLAYDRFSKSLPPTTKMDIETMWCKLESLYDLDALEAEATPPFPNEKKEFSLPVGWVSDNREDKKEPIKKGGVAGGGGGRGRRRKKYSSSVGGGDEEQDDNDDEEETDSSSSSNSSSNSKIKKKRITRGQQNQK